MAPVSPSGKLTGSAVDRVQGYLNLGAKSRSNAGQRAQGQVLIAGKDLAHPPGRYTHSLQHVTCV